MTRPPPCGRPCGGRVPTGAVCGRDSTSGVCRPRSPVRLKWSAGLREGQMDGANCYLRESVRWVTWPAPRLGLSVDRKGSATQRARQGPEHRPEAQTAGDAGLRGPGRGGGRGALGVGGGSLGSRCEGHKPSAPLAVLGVPLPKPSHLLLRTVRKVGARCHFGGKGPRDPLAFSLAQILDGGGAPGPGIRDLCPSPGPLSANGAPCEGHRSGAGGGPACLHPRRRGSDCPELTSAVGACAFVRVRARVPVCGGQRGWADAAQGPLSGDRKEA